jgi:hypothetical protein
MVNNSERPQRTKQQMSPIKRRRLLKTLGVATGAAALPVGTATAGSGDQKPANVPPTENPVHVFELDTTGYENLAAVYAKIYPGAVVEFEIEGNVEKEGTVGYEIILHNTFNDAGKFTPGRATAEITPTEVPERPLEGGEESGEAVQESSRGAKQ